MRKDINIKDEQEEKDKIVSNEEQEEKIVPKIPEEESEEESGEGEKEIDEVEKRLQTYQAINKEFLEKMEQLKEMEQKKFTVITKEVSIKTKTILETDPIMRKKAPFVQISKGIENFVLRIKQVVSSEDPHGGVLVPVEFRAEVIRFATEAAIVRPRARIFRMTRDTLTMPSLNQSVDQFGGVTFAYAGETTTIAKSRPSFGRITLNVRKLTAMADISNEILADSAIGVANFLTVLFGNALVHQEDQDFLTGSGVTRPLGIIADTRIPTIVRKTAIRVVYDDLVKMYEKLPAYATAGATWITSKAGIGQLMRMRADAITAGDSAGSLVYLPSMQINVPAVVFGIPILVTDKLPAIGTQGDFVLGNLSDYFIGDKGAMEIASSIHNKFEQDMTTLRIISRIDGQPALPKSFVVLK